MKDFPGRHTELFSTSEMVKLLNPLEIFNEDEKPRVKNIGMLYFIHDVLSNILSERIPNLAFESEVDKEYLAGIRDGFCIALGHEVCKEKDIQSIFAGVEVATGNSKGWNPSYVNIYEEEAANVYKLTEKPN